MAGIFLKTSENTTQKEKIYNMILPYANQLNDESQLILTSIKVNLGLSVAMREIRPGCDVWTNRLRKYIKLYGLKFSKQEHLNFIGIMYELILIPHLEPYLFREFTELFIALLKKKELISPTELTLPWKPLYNLCKTILFSSRVSLGMYGYPLLLQKQFISVVHAARFYFPASATEEMLEEWKPMLCPFDSGTVRDTIQIMSYFLPVTNMSENDKGYKMWLDELMTFWKICNNICWESNLMELMSVLAKNNIGYIEWKPYIPLMYSRFLQCFQLPVCYRQSQVADFHALNISAIACWIVSTLGGSSTAQNHLSNFMKSLESYFHHSNNGRWTTFLGKLLEELVAQFVERLNYERHVKLTWQVPVPEAKKLTEDDITQFVESLRFCTFKIMFSSMKSAVKVSVQYLAMLRPQLIIPHVIESFYLHVEGTYGPHHFRAVLQCLTAVLRPMLESTCGYKDGPSHVIPLLMTALPGIDPNDTEKSVDTLDFINTMASLVPIVDCSKATEFHNNLTKEEEAICLATSSFEDFVLQFLDHCFMFITNSSLDSIDLEHRTYKESNQESSILRALWMSCTSVFQQASLEIFEAGLNKLYCFATENIFERQVAGQLLGSICQSFAQVNAKITLQRFIPFLSSNILSMMSSNDVLQEDSLTSELLYYLLLISEIVHCPGCNILPHASLLRKVLDKSLQLSCREGFTMALNLMSGFLNSLLSIVPVEYHSVPSSFNKSLREYLPIRDWGRLGDIYDLKLEFFVPGEHEIECVKSVVDMYLPLQVDFINKMIENISPLIDDKLEFALEIIRVLLDSRSLFPSWDGPPVQLVDSFLKDNFFHSDVQLKQIIAKNKNIAISDDNTRRSLVVLLSKLQSKLLLCKEHNTKSLSVLIQIWDILLTNKFNKIVYATHWSIYQSLKRYSGNKLIGNKSHVRSLLISRVLLQHELLLGRDIPYVTSIHKDIMMNLLQLCTSSYSNLRYEARRVLSYVLMIFPYSHTILTSEISEYLKKDAIVEPDIFEGAIQIILEPKCSPIVVHHDWEVLHLLWPNLIKSKPEKVSILGSLKTIERVVKRQLGTITINLELSDDCVEYGVKLCKSASHYVLKEHIDQGKQRLDLRTQNNLESYLSLLHLLVKLIEGENLHNRFHYMAMTFLMSLIHPDVLYPSQVVKCFLNYLLNDSLELRRIAIEAVTRVLKQQKKTCKKIKLNPLSFQQLKKVNKVFPGDRPDNTWVKYSAATLPQNADDWYKMHFLHREYHGYYCWPNELTLYAPSHEQWSATSTLLKEKEEEVNSFFSNSENVDKLIYFLSLEENKGEDKFSNERYLMFKGLFRNGGYVLFETFIPHVNGLVCSSHESSQRCAAEIIAGSIRGAKHWPYEMLTDMWEIIVPVIKNVLQHMTEESITDWKICFKLASENRDPQWNHWLYNVLLNYPVQSNAFLEAEHLSCIECVLHCHLWKMSEVLTLWLSVLKLCLSHQFEIVRQRVGEALSCIFEADVSFPGGNPPISPHIYDFIAYILPSLSLFYADENIRVGEKYERTKVSATRLLKTVCVWMSTMITRSVFGISSAFYQLVPLICFMENCEMDSELALLCSHVLGKMAQAIHESSLIPPALSAMRKASDCVSWKTRIVCLKYLQVFVFYNMPVILINTEWAKEVISIVLKLLEDDSLEVREKSAQVLCDLLHTGFIRDILSLLNNFKHKVGFKRSKQCVSLDPTFLRMHHAAVLGLCAFINAYPYDVPDVIPDLLPILQNHLNDSHPIPQTIRKTLSDFQRTHRDNWTQNRLKFSEEQLSILENLEPLSYYA